ncbi:MAG: sigma-70 family RNA polymerase sigma factor [Verrucomicrobiae bacterium]|nr:sigma-70 family RNA polymerase sigma factor [Verrucomicrobiae bacterium]
MGSKALHIVSETEDYAEQMASHQARLESFIRSLTGDSDAARDILQEANIIMLRKAREFEAGTNFSAWAFRIARFEVMTWRRKMGRSRLTFDNDLVDQMAETAERLDDTYLSRVEALQECLSKLPERQRDIVRQRYLEERSVADLAEESGDNANSISQLLFRARQNLLKCVEKTLQRASV